MRERHMLGFLIMGNEVQQIHYPHLIHGFVNMTALKAAKDATKDLLKTYKNFLK